MSPEQIARPVELRAGGWFVIDEERGWSGPWRTEAAAQASARFDYGEAHRLDRPIISEGAGQ